MLPITDPLAYLRSTQAIRERCQHLFDLGVQGELAHFNLHLERLDAVANIVKSETLRQYPTLEVPYHSRWRHFNVGDLDRIAVVNEILKGIPARERCRSKIEMAIISVLLDAGAGDVWGFVDNNSRSRHKRSEGLAIASLYAYGDGVFGPEPFVATGERLRAITPGELGQAFQVSKDNPLLGVEGRCALLNALGRVIAARPQDFKGSPGRLGGILEPLLGMVKGKEIKASDILTFILTTFSEIWPGRIVVQGQNLGDVWRHPKVSAPGETNGLVPFHKLSQWLTYSLLEPLEDPAAATVEHLPSAEIIVEWRALTIILLDQTATRLREMLGKNEVDLPLAKVLQGGTWSVGRTLATGRRAGGGPPLKIQSDGTVF